MEQLAADTEGVSIVLRGHFNPAIITHGWLMAQKLISVEDFTETRPDLLTPDVSHFETPWFQCHATSDMLQISTGDPSEMERARDIAVGILRALPHTPVAVMGLNDDFHFQTKGQSQWDAVGDALAPKEPWADTLRFPGTLSLVMLAARTDEETGRVRVTVEPSNRVSPFGIYVGYNDHFSLVPAGKRADKREDMVDEVKQKSWNSWNPLPKRPPRR